MNSHVGHNKRMRARESGRWDYTRKRNMEGELRRLGQTVGEIDPGWVNVKGGVRSSEETWS
jgi:hypothetical protein